MTQEVTATASNVASEGQGADGCVGEETAIEYSVAGSAITVNETCPSSDGDTGSFQATSTTLTWELKPDEVDTFTLE